MPRGSRAQKGARSQSKVSSKDMTRGPGKGDPLTLRSMDLEPIVINGKTWVAGYPTINGRKYMGNWGYFTLSKWSCGPLLISGNGHFGYLFMLSFRILQGMSYTL